MVIDVLDRPPGMQEVNGNITALQVTITVTMSLLARVPVIQLVGLFCV
jgi:hypothetical protein